MFVNRRHPLKITLINQSVCCEVHDKDIVFIDGDICRHGLFDKGK